MSTALLPPGRTTYRQPQTFCRIVIELIEKKGWKIKVHVHTLFGQGAGISLTLPDGMAVSGNHPEQALIELCQKFVSKHGIPVAYDNTLGGMENLPAEVEPKAKDEGTFHHGFTSHTYFHDEFYEEEMKRAPARCPKTWTAKS